MPKQSGSFDASDLIKGLKNFGEDMYEASNKGLKDAAEYVLGEATKIVPHQDGILQASGKASADPGNFKAYVSFDTPYAVKQHEDMSLKHPNGRKAKYLEIPLTTSGDVITQLIARRLRRAMG